jgi:hypothetical protein
MDISIRHAVRRTGISAHNVDAVDLRLLPPKGTCCATLTIESEDKAENVTLYLTLDGLASLLDDCKLAESRLAEREAN